MINAFLTGERKPIVDKPSDLDRDAGRTERLPIWATSAVLSVVWGRASETGWALSATVENAISSAVQCAQGEYPSKKGSGPAPTKNDASELCDDSLARH